MEETIDLKEYFEALKKRGWIVILTTFIAITISGVLSFFVMEPIYQAELTFMVNFSPKEESQLTKDEMEYGTNLVETYKPIITSRKVITEIKSNLDLNMDQNEITKSIQINSISGSVMSITVDSTDPVIATNIANSIPSIFGKELKRIAKVHGIEVIDTATVPKTPIKPEKIKNIVIAAGLGIIVSTGFIFLLEALDNKIKTIEDIEKHIELPVLGSISEFNNKNLNRDSKKRLNGKHSVSKKRLNGKRGLKWQQT